jgi:O-antigen/teichoic acid export membrane protein
MINTLSSILSLGIIYLLTKVTSSGSLLYVAAVFSAAPALVYLTICFLTFYGKYHYLLPSIKCVKLRYSKDLIGLGISFFVIQVAALVLFATSNLIIAQLFGPSEVTIYNIAYKYFSVIAMGFTIMLTPLWNAYTDAYVKGDFEWIRNVIRKIMFIWGIGVLGVIVMLIISPWVYEVWVGEKVASSIPISVSIACAIYVSIFNWNSIFSYFVNGVGKIRLQLYTAVVIMILFIPLSLWMGERLGISGIIYALCSVLLAGSIIQPVQDYKIINQTATGIWNK